MEKVIKTIGKLIYAALCISIAIFLSIKFMHFFLVMLIIGIMILAIRGKVEEIQVDEIHKYLQKINDDLPVKKIEEIIAVPVFTMQNSLIEFQIIIPSISKTIVLKDVSALIASIALLLGLFPALLAIHGISVFMR